jgi:CDP-diacylglycerol--glycerol-3-phosphate 3-phosphatidyltransferase
MGLKQAWTDGARKAVVPVANTLALSRITPNKLTIAGLLIQVAITPLIIIDFDWHFLLAAVALVFASSFDMLDGAVARVTAKVTPFGAFFDSTCDRLAEAIVLGAVGIYYAEHDDYVMLGVVILVIAFSFLVSYTRARAEAVGVECKVGFASRPERIVGLAIGLVLANWWVAGLSAMLLLLLVLTAWTTVVRVQHVRRQMEGPAAAPQDPPPGDEWDALDEPAPPAPPRRHEAREG